MRRRAFLLGVPLLARGRALAAPAAPVTALVFTPDGRALVYSGYGELVARPVSDASAARRIPCGLAQVHALAFHPAGRLLAAAGGTPGTRGEVRLLSWPDGKPLGTRGAFRDLATGLAFSPDGRRLAVSSSDGTVEVWEADAASGTAPGAPLLTLRGHTGPVPTVTFTADGKLLVTGSADRTLRVWNAETGELQRALTNHTGGVHCLAARPRDAGAASAPPSVASGSEDRTVRVWQPGIGRMVRIVRGSGGPVLAVCYSPDGRRLFAAGTEGLVRALDAESDQVLGSWKASDDWVYCLAVSPDGSRLAAGDATGKVGVSGEW